MTSLAAAQLPQRPPQAYHSPHSATKSVDSSASSIFTASSPVSSAATTPRSRSDDSMSSVLSNGSGAGPAILDRLIQELAVSESIYLSELALLPQNDILLKNLQKAHQRLNHNISSLMSWGPTVTTIYQQYIEKFSYDTDLSPQILYLSRRPLIRLKLLSKVYKKIAENDPDNSKKTVLASTFQGLVASARAKYESERQRVRKNKIDFSLTLSLETHKPVSASFSLSKVILRARFEGKAKTGNGEVIQTFPAELLLLAETPDSIDYEGLAICGLRPDSAVPYLVFPILRPGDVSFISDPKTLSLKFLSTSCAGSEASMICHNPDQHSEWATKCRMLFSQPCTSSPTKQQPSSPQKLSGLGIMDVIPPPTQTEAIVPAPSSGNSFLHGPFASRLRRSEASRTPLANISNQENNVARKPASSPKVPATKQEPSPAARPTLKRSPASKDISQSRSEESLDIDFGFSKESSFMDNPEIKAFMVEKSHANNPEATKVADEWKKPIIPRSQPLRASKKLKNIVGESKRLSATIAAAISSDTEQNKRLSPVRSSSAPDVLEGTGEEAHCQQQQKDEEEKEEDSVSDDGKPTSLNDDYWATMSFINPTADLEIRQVIAQKAKAKKQTLSTAAKRVSARPEKIIRSLLSSKPKKQVDDESTHVGEQEQEQESKQEQPPISADVEIVDKKSKPEEVVPLAPEEELRGMERLRNTRPISIAVPQRPTLQEIKQQQQQQHNSTILNQLAPIPEHASPTSLENGPSTPKSAPPTQVRGGSSLLSSGRSIIYKTIASVSRWEGGNWVNVNEKSQSQSRINVMVDGDGGIVEVWPMASGQSDEPLLVFNVNMETVFTKGTQVDLNVRYYGRGGQQQTIMFRTRSGSESDQLLHSFNASRMVLSYPNLKSAGASPLGFGVDSPCSTPERLTPPPLISAAGGSFESTASTTCSSCSSFSSVSTNSAGSSSSSSSCSSPTNSIRMSFLPYNMGNSEAPDSAFYPLASDIKCKLLGRHHNARQTNDWKVMGQCLLTLQLVAVKHSGNKGKSEGDVDKRLIVRKSGGRGEVLIDWILSPSAFERVGRVGISVHILKQETKPQAIQSSSKDGNGRHEVFMLQFKGERDAYMIANLIGNVKKN